MAAAKENKVNGTLPVQEAGSYWEELVEYEAPLVSPDGRNSVVVSVNNETLRIQRGVPVKIKRKFVEVLRRAAEESRDAVRNAESARLSGKKPLAEL